MDANFTDKVEWFKDNEWSIDKGDRLTFSEGTALERRVRLVEDVGGVIHYINHAEGGDRTVLVTPREFVGGETPSSSPFTATEVTPPTTLLSSHFTST